MTYVYKTMPSPVGKLKLIASEKGLAGILWEKEKPQRVRHLAAAVKDNQNPILLKTERQLNEYFAGKRKSFDLSLDFAGTPFHQKVWKALLRIPYGQTFTYGAISKKINRPTAVRAVGGAIGRNPISIIAPCHRVIGANGKLTGFAGGLKAKAYLLDLERE